MRTREIKAGLVVPWFEDEAILNAIGKRVGSEATAYSKIPLIYRAIRLRCNSLVRVPVYVYRGKYDRGTPLEEYQFENDLPLHDLLWMSEASILLTGAGYILKKQNQYGYSKGLQWLNPFTVRQETVNGQLMFYQEMPNGERFPKGKKYWTLDEMLYFRDFNPSDDIGPGVSATSLALTDGNILYSGSRFLSNFFSADALPITIVTMPGAIQKGERERVETWFKDKVVKMRNAAARILGVSGDVKLEKLTSDLETFDFDKVDTHAIQQIAWAFDIPKTVLTADSANRSTADTEYATYIEDTVIPRCNYYEKVVNGYLSEFNQRIEFAPEELSVLQVDESERADSLGKLVSAGIPLRAALDILGYDLSEEAQAELDKAEDKKEAEPPAVEEEEPEEEVDEEMKAELEKWMRKSLNRLKAGKAAAVEFESVKIPHEIKVAVSEALGLSETEAQVKAVFTKVTEVSRGK
jgi:HK97 family phage portal protein